VPTSKHDNCNAKRIIPVRDCVDYKMACKANRECGHRMRWEKTGESAADHCVRA